MKFTPSDIKQIPMIIATYNGCAKENTANIIETIPIIKVINEVNNDISLLEINPSIPKTIIMNPTI